MIEEWRDIKGYEGYYQVSNFGRIKSMPHEVVRRDGKNFISKEKILKHGIRSDSRHLVVLCVNNIRSSRLVHRLVAQAFIPNPDNLPEVNHKDENPNNNVADNLEWCTDYYNHHYGTAIERMRKSLTGRKQTPEEILKRSKALKGHKAYNKGCHISQEHKEKISKSMKKSWRQRLQVNN